MADLVSCPSCARPVQIPEDHAAGQQVLCPACGARFAPAGPEGLPPSPAAEEVQEVLPVAVQRPRQRGPDIEQRPCPECGADLPVNIHHCPACGADIAADEERPWEEWGEVRRNVEPARGGLILTLGILSIVLSMCCGFIGLGLGIAAWIMGSRDLKKIQARVMDPAERGTTQAGYICGIVGAILGAVTALLAIAWVVFEILLFTYMFRKLSPDSSAGDHRSQAGLTATSARRGCGG